MKNFDLNSLKRLNDRMFSTALFCVLLHIILAGVTGLLLGLALVSTEVTEAFMYTCLLVFWIYFGWFR